jgi:hypothetical protein
MDLHGVCRQKLQALSSHPCIGDILDAKNALFLKDLPFLERTNYLWPSKRPRQCLGYGRKNDQFEKQMLTRHTSNPRVNPSNLPGDYLKKPNSLSRRKRIKEIEEELSILKKELAQILGIGFEQT